MNARRYTSIITLACVLLFVMLSAGCELLGGEGESAVCELLGSEDESEKYTIEVHIQGGFGRAHVRVAIDECVVFDDALTGEEPFSGPVKMIMVEARQGRHHIQVGINGINQEETTFTVDSKLYIGVQNTSTGILFRIQKTPFGYL